MIKSVQRFKGSISAVSTVNVAIAEIDALKTVVNKTSWMRQNNQNDSLTFTLTSPTNVEVRQRGDDTADYSFEVIEFQ